MKKLLIIPTLFLFACGGGEAANSESNKGSNTATVQHTTKTADVSVDVFKAGVESGNCTVLDVRTPGEIAQGKIEGAVEININDADFVERVNQLDKSKPVYVYCKAGGRSSRAMKIMAENGFSEVNNLDGGISAWIAAGYPTSK